MKSARFALFSILIILVACSPESGGTTKRGKLIQVHVTVFAWNDARVGAVLIDKAGRRTGWDVDRPIREIAGTMHGYGSEEGLPPEPGDSVYSDQSTTTLNSPSDSVPGGPQPTPMYHYFTIQDSADAPSVLDQGGCELRLDPDVAGKVHLTLIANGVGFSECTDTTSVWVQRGVSSRWLLAWKVTKTGCRVKISQATRGSTTRRLPTNR